MFYTECRKCRSYEQLVQIFDKYRDSKFTKSQYMQGLLFGLIAIGRRIRSVSVHNLENHSSDIQIRQIRVDIDPNRVDIDSHRVEDVLNALLFVRQVFYEQFQDTLDYHWLSTVLFGNQLKTDPRLVPAFWKLLNCEKTENLQHAYNFDDLQYQRLCGHIFFLCLYHHHYERVYDLLDYIAACDNIRVFVETAEQYSQREFLSPESRMFAQKCLERFHNFRDNCKKLSCRSDFLTNASHQTNVKLFDDDNLNRLIDSL